ncbi:MAG TPA: ATP-binding protein [Nitriliruptorales bacterium]|nr:ATP-binding protein [Nitriliruptorales bacterium]
MQRSVLTGIAGFRWVAWAWMAAVLVLSRRRLTAGWLAVSLVLMALLLTIGATLLLHRRRRALTAPVWVAVELALGACLLLADGVVYGQGHVFTPEQSLGVAWPLAGVLTAGVAGGPWSGLSAGVLMGASRAGAAALNGADLVVAAHTLSLVSTTVLYALAGGVAGYLVVLLRRAEREISAARARDEVARTLHDGVLQTLAVIERRTQDPALGRLAREQEVQLRRFLFGDTVRGADAPPDLGAALRAAAARFEDVFGARVDVLVADDLPALDPARCEAIAGAVGEALTNAGKHGAPRRVTVYCEPDGDGVFCSVKDDGTGFDPATTPEGAGIAGSVRGRLRDVDGRVEITSAPARGTEVRLWVR